MQAVLSNRAMEWSREQVLAFVRRSPEFVAAHDKEGWVGLFAPGAVVEDPVGSSPARKGEGVRDGDDELGRFYETYIARNDVRFEVLRDIVKSTTVVRDVVITTKTPNGATVELPAYLIYECEDAGGALAVRRMRAFWELRGVTKHALTSGLGSIVAMTSLTARMVQIQGASSVSTYLEGLWRGIFDRGHEAARSLATAIAERDEAALRAIFAGDGAIELEPGEKIAPARLLSALGPGAELAVEAPLSSGFFTGFRVTLVRGGAKKSGVALLEFDPHTRLCASARFFIE